MRSSVSDRSTEELAAAGYVRERTSERELRVGWRDPLASLGALAGLSGLEAMQKIAAGEVPPPPIAVLLGFGVYEVENGRALFYGEPGEEHYNPIGVVHGGLAATLLDSCMGCAVHTTLELKVNFVRPISRDTGRIAAEGRVIHRGGQVATVEGELRSESDNKLLAHGTSTCLIIGEPKTARHNGSG